MEGLLVVVIVATLALGAGLGIGILLSRPTRPVGVA